MQLDGDVQWQTELPELYPRMLEEEGPRTSARGIVLLEDVFQLDDLFSLSAVHIHVTGDLIKDVEELNFGLNNDLTYDNCHHGLLPFAIIGVSMAMASKSRHPEDQFSHTSTLTLAEVRVSVETTSDVIPSDYHGMINLLKCYVELLWLDVGPQFGHDEELVLWITADLNARQHIFEALAAQQIVPLLWQVFYGRPMFLLNLNQRLGQPSADTSTNDIRPGEARDDRAGAPQHAVCPAIRKKCRRAVRGKGWTS
jgi:hypothetical protein